MVFGRLSLTSKDWGLCYLLPSYTPSDHYNPTPSPHPSRQRTHFVCISALFWVFSAFSSVFRSLGVFNLSSNRFLLEWTRERRAAWNRSRIRHQVKPCQQALRTSKRHKWPSDDAASIWQEACNNRKCLYTTMTNPDEVKDKLYDDLDSLISATLRTDKLILPGDFNARVGTYHQTWQGVIGTEGIGKCNSNGLLLSMQCAEYELLITNTVFHLPTRNKTSWMHPCFNQWHLIDYVILRRKDRQDVSVRKTICGADCWTDHWFVVSKLSLRVQPVRRP